MRVEYDFENVIGYLSTWSPLNNYKQSHPDAEDPLRILAKKFQESLDIKNKIVVVYPGYLIYASQ